MNPIASPVPVEAQAPATTKTRALSAGVALVAALAVAKLLLHLLTTGRFGYDFFVDELYYLALGEHLAWGFVDVPPLFPALTALVRALLGESLLAVRLVPALAGAALVLATGLFARRLAGGRVAMGLAALGVLAAPIFLAMHSFHTMNALEPLFWLAAAWLLVRILDGENPRLWLAFGAVAGLGLLNKHSMAFFGVAVVAGLVATPARRVFRERWIWLGGLVALAIFLSNLVWVVTHGFPHLQVLAQVAEDGRNVSLPPWLFLAQQALMLHPLSLPLWLGGLGFFLLPGEGSRWRPLGIAYLVTLALMLLLDGRVYYLAPAYPMLLAAGGVALERWAHRLARGWLLPAYGGVLALGGAALAPLFVPLLPPQTLIRYSEATGLTQPRIESHRLGPLPQLMADRFGWREMAQEVARVYHALPPEERAVAAVFGQNYGQAGAIDLFGPELGLPKAISGHLAYHDWGPRSSRGEVVIVMDDDRETLERLFEEVEWAGRFEHPYSMPHQHFDLHVCRRLKMPIEELWPQVRKWR